MRTRTRVMWCGRHFLSLARLSPIAPFNYFAFLIFFLAASIFSSVYRLCLTFKALCYVYFLLIRVTPPPLLPMSAASTSTVHTSEYSHFIRLTDDNSDASLLGNSHRYYYFISLHTSGVPSSFRVFVSFFLLCIIYLLIIFCHRFFFVHLCRRNTPVSRSFSDCAGFPCDFYT